MTSVSIPCSRAYSSKLRNCMRLTLPVWQEKPRQCAFLFKQTKLKARAFIAHAVTACVFICFILEDSCLQQPAASSTSLPMSW